MTLVRYVVHQGLLGSREQKDMTIKEAILSVNREDDTQWTSDGLPMVEAVQRILGRPVTRQQITDADPEFSRDKANLPLLPPETQPSDLTLDQQMAILDAYINKVSAEQNRIANLMDALQRKRRNLQAKLYRTSTSAQEMNERITYIRRQNELRHQRVTGQVMAPIDQAMARRKGFGSQRPVRS